VATVRVVHVGLAALLASTARREGPLGEMALSPIAEALQEERRGRPSSARAARKDT
jgi:hypothetical protein